MRCKKKTKKGHFLLMMDPLLSCIYCSDTPMLFILHLNWSSLTSKMDTNDEIHCTESNTQQYNPVNRDGSPTSRTTDPFSIYISDRFGVSSRQRQLKVSVFNLLKLILVFKVF